MLDEPLNRNALSWNYVALFSSLARDSKRGTAAAKGQTRRQRQRKKMGVEQWRSRAAAVD
ncbi:hypothetical protein BHE74_00023609 [Ensete ventricosum]|nr:hypothetical protein BHE74_00023609 [Ensete ventricosum]RZR89709.1 hypothetical protein BHM03_00017482 [Ensete ventricosum]